MAATDALATALASFEPISLEAVNRATALEHRVDSKYIVEADSLSELADRLRGTHQVLEIEGRRAFGYSTVYFDTAGLTSYRSYVQQRRRRFVCRSRHYIDTGRHTFEVKLKGQHGITIKKQLSYRPADATRVTIDALAFLRNALHDEYGRTINDRLVPMLTTEYTRMTLSSAANGERITCDVALRYAMPNGATFAMAPDYLVVETKRLCGTSSADKTLRALGARPARMSKYILGLTLSEIGPRGNDFRQLLKRYFELLPASATSTSVAMPALSNSYSEMIREDPPRHQHAGTVRSEAI